MKVNERVLGRDEGVFTDTDWTILWSKKTSGGSDRLRVDGRLRVHSERLEFDGVTRVRFIGWVS